MYVYLKKLFKIFNCCDLNISLKSFLFLHLTNLIKLMYKKQKKKSLGLP